MKQTIRRFNWMSIALVAAALFPATACSDSEDDTAGSGGSSGKGGKDDAGAPTSLFAIPTQVYGADFATSTSYIPIVPSLDVAKISLDDARELDERGTAAKLGDYFYLASSSKPVVNRYQVLADGSLEAAGSLNFANYGVPEYFTIDSWGGVLVDAERAYVFNGTDGSHVAWNPSTMEITGTIPGPDLVQEGYNFESIAVVRGDRMYRLFTFLNYDTWEFMPDHQYLAVYDLKTDKLLDLTEENRCPQLYNRPFVDEKGDIYFSGWVWTAGLTLTGDYPASCALRIKDGEDSFDPDWQLNFAADVTDGREAAMLRYLGDGKALLDVFHDERVTIDGDTDPQELMNTPNWRLWAIDLETNEGAPIEALDYKAGGYSDVQVDGRNFLMVPNGDYSETTAYEFRGSELEAGFKIQGSVDHIIKLR